MGIERYIMKKKIKRRKLKKWCEVLLGTISIITFILFGSDTPNLRDYAISHLIALTIFIIANFILYKYSDLFED